MRFSARPYLMAGVGIVAAGAIAIPQSVTPPSATPRHENVALSAHTQPVNPLLKQPPPEFATAQAATTLLPAAAFDSTEAMTETLDMASAQVSALALPGLESAIITAYDVIMPWVDWGVNLGIYATQWIPVVNWFTPQISIVYYSLIRPIITSAVFNIAYWVGGTVSFGQGLTNFFNDTVNAGIGFVNAEIDWFLSFLPPFPPFPPFFSSLAAQSTMEVMGARTAVQIPAGVGTGLDGVTDDESSTPPADETEETAPQTDSETPPAEPPAEHPAPTPADTELEDVEPQEPVETPAPDGDPKDDEDVTDREDVTDEDTEQDVDLEDNTDEDDTVQDNTVQDNTDVDSDVDTGTGTPDTEPGDKQDTKPDTKDDAKPSAKKDSGSDG
jgi:hypothetical protein